MYNRMRFFTIKNDFTFDFFTRRIRYPYYSGLYNTTNQQDCDTCLSVAPATMPGIDVVNLIPPYLNPEIDNGRPGYRHYKVHYETGFLARLDGYPSLKAYLKSRFGSKSSSRLRSSIRRLETCFPVRYTWYYGHIGEEEYRGLMRQFREMLQRRFLQRGDSNKALDIWEYYETTAFRMILEKKASLFVIYDDQKPIDICLNYHHQNIMINYIRSFDIDYAKFRPGYIDIYKQLEWCFANNYLVFDLSYGDMAYKRRWCNTEYRFDHHIIYRTPGLSNQVKAQAIRAVLWLKQQLKNYGLDEHLRRATAFVKDRKRPAPAETGPRFEVEEMAQNPHPRDALREIDLSMESYRFLRKPAYEFLYLYSCTAADIRICQLKAAENIYYIHGRDKIVKVVHLQ